MREGMLGDHDPRVAELSTFLRSLRLHPFEARQPTFRNPNGVARKLADLGTRLPGYAGKPTRGSALDEAMVRHWAGRPDELAEAARRIRETADALAHWPHDEFEDDGEPVVGTEGRLVLRLHRRRERDPKLRRAKLQAAWRQHGTLKCEVCGFDFSARYREGGEGYIECHHIVPLSQMKPDSPVKMSDLALLCANCHRIAHRVQPWRDVEGLRNLLR